MTARASADVASAQRELVITRIFDAPRRLVFKAWTEAEHAAGWWGPLGFITISCCAAEKPVPVTVMVGMPAEESR